MSDELKASKKAAQHLKELTINQLNEAITGLEEEIKHYKQHIKKQDIRIESLKYDLKPWLKGGG